MWLAPHPATKRWAGVQTQVILAPKLMVSPCTKPPCLWLIDRLKPEFFLPAWEGGKGPAQLHPPDPFSCPHAGAALRMASSRALSQQWRGSSAGFSRSQSVFTEDLAAGPGRFQNLSKNHLGRVLDPELLSHGILVPKTLEASL